MNKYGVLLALLSIALFPFSAVAVLFNPGDKDCKEALAFGTEHKDAIENTLDRKYSFNTTTPFSEEITIHTKWYKLALLSGLKARKGEVLAAQQQSEILLDPYLQINVKVYGHGLDFANGYTVSLIQKGREIKSDKIHADHFMNNHSGKKTFTGFPCCWAIIRTYFPYEKIDPESGSILIIKKDGKECRFEIDFSKYR